MCKNRRYIDKSTPANAKVHATHAKVHLQMDKYTLHTQKYTCKWASTRYTRKSRRSKWTSTRYILKSTPANGQVHATHAKVHLQMDKYTPHIYITKTIYHKPL